MMIAALLLAAAAATTPASEAAYAKLAAQAAQAREANRPGEAIPLYRRGVQLKPSWAEGWWYLGSLLYDQDRYAEARAPLARFLALTPKSGPGWALLGLCDFQAKDYTQALEHLRQAQALGIGESPQFSEVTRYHMGLLYTHFGEFEAATQTLFTFAIEGRESPGIIEAIGAAALRLPYLPAELSADQKPLALQAGRAVYDAAARRPQEAQREMEALAARHPETPGVHYVYGSYLLQENPDAGLKELQREIEISPKHVAARLAIAFEYIRRNEPQQGLAYAEEAVKLSPESFAARNALGRVYLGLGKAEESVRELERARQLAPDSPETRFALASAYARAGRAQDAARERSEFQRLNELRQSK